MSARKGRKSPLDRQAAARSRAAKKGVATRRRNARPPAATWEDFNTARGGKESDNKAVTLTAEEMNGDRIPFPPYRPKKPIREVNQLEGILDDGRAEGAGRAVPGLLPEDAALIREMGPGYATAEDPKFQVFALEQSMRVADGRIQTLERDLKQSTAEACRLRLELAQVRKSSTAAANESARRDRTKLNIISRVLAL